MYGLDSVGFSPCQAEKSKHLFEILRIGDIFFFGIAA